MGIGTSLGGHFDDEFHYQQNQHDPDKYPDNNVIDPVTTPDLNTNDNNVVKPNTAPVPTDGVIPISDFSDVLKDRISAIAENPLPGTASRTLTARAGVEHSPLGDAAGLNELGTQEKAPRSVVDKLLGVGGDRYQLWPERALRDAYEALKLPGDALAGHIDPMSPKGLERVNTLAGLMVMGPAPVAKAMADGTLGSFAGVKSKTIHKDDLYEALKMQSDGAHPDEIWQQAKHFQGADGKWRYEISDQNAKLKDTAFDKTILENNPNAGGEDSLLYSVSHLKDATLKDALDHPELFKAYPELKDIKLRPMPKSEGSIGMMDLHDNTMYLKDDLHPAFARSVLLHELQHKIQQIEGFSLGGNLKEFVDKGFDLPIAGEKYKRLAGEVEARNVQTRMDYNDARRMLHPPRTTEDRPRFTQIQR